MTFKRDGSFHFLPDQVVNGNFATDTVWTKGTGWTIASGVATKVSGASSEIYQNQTLIAGELYAITYTIYTRMGTGGIRVFLGASTTAVTCPFRYANGTYTEYLVVNPTNARMGVQVQADTSCSIDNVSIRRIARSYEKSNDGSYWVMSLVDGAEVRQFGAKGNGSGDDLRKIQDAIDAMSTVVVVVKGRRSTYNLSDTLSIIQQTTSWHDTKRVSFIGDGSGLTRFFYTGVAADKAVIDWGVDNALDTDGTYGSSWARIGGFSIEATNKANYGLRITAKSWFEANDIKILGAVERNFHFRSTVSWSGRSLRSYGAKYGMFAELSSAPLAYSVPNNITLIDCTLGNATAWGMYARNCGPINLIGGSVEGCGAQGVDALGGIYIIRNDASIGV